MAINIDGIVVLRAIAENPVAFPDVAAEVNNVARALVVKQIKAKTVTLELLRQIHSLIGSEAFELILDDLDAKNSAALVKKFDKENAELNGATPPWLRKQLASLASGAANPVGKPPKPTPPKKPTGGKKPGLSPEHKALAVLLKAKEINLVGARDLWNGHGDNGFTPALGSLTEKQTQDLAKRLDKDNDEIVGSTQEALRERIVLLASGRAEPVFKSIMESKSLAAVGRRRRD